MTDFTVAIPTYNGAQRLPEVLNQLRSQSGTEHLSWEVIVVDNNSNDNTAQVVQNYQATWSQGHQLRYCLETEQGAAFARQRAVEEAQGQYIGFLDDDNVPASNWVAAAYEFGLTHPQAGAYGSQIQGEFEVEPPEDFQRIAYILALTNRGPEAHPYEPRKKILPPGAGLVVRKQAWCETVPSQLTLNHTGKEAGLASEDLEVLLHIQQAGWEIWYNPEMRVSHKIPAWRLKREYLMRSFRCVGLSRHHLRMMPLSAWQRPLAMPLYAANDLRKLILCLIKYRGAIKTDLVAACEVELFSGSFLSPLFLWRIKHFSRPKPQKTCSAKVQPQLNASQQPESVSNR